MVGVEIAEEPVAELFQENHIDHVVEEVHDCGNIYKVTSLICLTFDEAKEIRISIA